MADIRKILAKRVSYLRKRLGFNQAKLGKMVHLSLTSISAIETANSWPEHETIKNLAEALKVPEESLFQDPDLIIPPTIPEALDVIAKAFGMEAPKPRKGADTTKE